MPLFASTLVLFAHTYAVDGIVVAIDRQARTMLVSHRPIAHYMPAMMMPFRVDDGAELSALHPGERVRFELTVTRSIAVARHVRATGDPDSTIPAPAEKLAIGARLPEFALTDQAGRTVRAGDLVGRPVAIDFIYTRCPLPDVCPRLAANFAVLQRTFGERVTLLSVTVDPDHDTPAVLAAYSRRWSAGAGWHFLTGDVAPLARVLGELYWADEGSIGHNSTTAIFDRNGRLAATIEGPNYRPDQLVNLISHVLETNP
jgi:protein SCO1/2